MKNRVMSCLSELITLIIITIPSFLILLNNKYFTMHDDQHIARLYLLVTAIKQGSIFPRWVDLLGFGFGYPLFNFYPPLIYYVSAIFYFLGFSLIWSVKLMIILGFLLSAYGSYQFIKKILGRWPALVGSTVYTYFLYHSVTVYVRGALAEYFTLSILPLVFLSLYNLAEEINWKNSIWVAISFAFLILTHPLIAFPSTIFISLFVIFLLLVNKNKVQYFFFSLWGGILALGLSAFFWLPSMVERKYTLVDAILTKELANYADHFVYPFQLWYSPWGYGGSVKGPADGLTFQLGKIPILFIFLSLVFGFFYFLKKKTVDIYLKVYLFMLSSFFVSLFMMTQYSSFIWNRISFLWYIQFPWRFLTFTDIFIAVLAAFAIFFFKNFLDMFNKKNNQLIMVLLAIIAVLITVVKYYPYFKPQKLIETNDQQRISFQEIAWRVSGTSYEFVPNTVKTKKTALGTTTLAINQNELPQAPAVITSGQATIKIIKDNFSDKEFEVNTTTPSVFQLNTYNFPGWEAQIDGKTTEITANNKLSLITVQVSQGIHRIKFVFVNTMIRTVADDITLISLLVLLILVVVR